MSGTVTRQWAAWVALWCLAGSALLWGTAALEAADLLSRPGVVEVDEVAAGDRVVGAALALGVAFPVVLVGGAQAQPTVRRAFLLLGSVALLVSGWAWAGVPDAGPLWPSVAVAAAALLVLGGTTGLAGGGGGRVAGVTLATAGGVVAVIGWRALEYNDWYVSLGVTAPMWAAFLGGLALVPLGLLGHRLPDTTGTRACATVVAGVAALVTLVPAVGWMLEMGQLQRHEESESGWAAVVPVVVGTGFLAAAFAARRHRWSLAALSLAVGLGLASGAVLRSDLARFLW